MDTYRHFRFSDFFASRRGKRGVWAPNPTPEGTAEALRDRLRLGATVVGLCLLAALLWALPVRGEASRAPLAWRVVAASDTEADQADKLALRDALRPLVSETVAGCRGADEALEALGGRREEILGAARACLGSRGSSAEVCVRVEPHRFEATADGALVWPAGTYPTYTVTVGAGEGHNWWGLLYPDMALFLASDIDPSALGLGGGAGAADFWESAERRCRTWDALCALWQER